MSSDDNLSAPARALPAGMAEVLTAVPGDLLRQQFAEFFAAAVKATEALTDFELAVHETDQPLGRVTEPQALWLQVAPAVKYTINSVNAFLAVVRRHWPPPKDFLENAEGPANAREDYVEFGGGKSKGGGYVAYEAAVALWTVGAHLLRDLSLFRTGVHAPEEITNREQLFDLLVEFRRRFKRAIGEMVYRAASVWAEVRREQVVPFFLHDMEAAARTRRDVVGARRSLFMLQVALSSTASPAEQSVWVSRCIEELESFYTTAGFKQMAAAEKKALRDARGSLESCLAEPQFSVSAAATAVDSVLSLFDAMQAMNQRAVLLERDRYYVKAVTDSLTLVAGAVAKQEVELARDQLRVTVAAAQELLGRDENFDRLLFVVPLLVVDKMDLNAVLSASELIKKALDAVAPF